MKYEPDQQYNSRYRTEQQGFWWWVIKRGTGTRSVLKAHTERGAQELVQELLTAFRDGEFVGQVAADAKAQQWQLAVDQLLSGWYSTADSYDSPHEAIKALIAFEVTAALDPRVSSDAAALVEQGRQEERARHRKNLEAEHDELKALLTRASKSLIEVVRMPNMEHVADNHNAVVISIRALAAKEK